MSLDALLNMRADVYATVNTKAASGGLKKQAAATAKATSVACRVQDSGAGQVVMADGRQEVSTHTIYTQYAGSSTGDEWRVNGSVYRYLGSNNRNAIGNMPAFVVIQAQEVKP